MQNRPLTAYVDVWLGEITGIVFFSLPNVEGNPELSFWDENADGLAAHDDTGKFDPNLPLSVLAMP